MPDRRIEAGQGLFSSRTRGAAERKKKTNKKATTSATQNARGANPRSRGTQPNIDGFVSSNAKRGKKVRKGKPKLSMVDKTYLVKASARGYEPTTTCTFSDFFEKKEFLMVEACLRDRRTFQ